MKQVLLDFCAVSTDFHGNVASSTIIFFFCKASQVFGLFPLLLLVRPLRHALRGRRAHAGGQASDMSCFFRAANKIRNLCLTKKQQKITIATYFRRN